MASTRVRSMAMAPSLRRENRERRTLEVMVGLYCRETHGRGSGLCVPCQRLLGYAFERIENCPWGDEKPTCANCSVHCYRAEERLQILEQMRYAGPRMLKRHPVLAILHLIDKGRASDLESLRAHRDRRRPQTDAS